MSKQYVRAVSTTANVNDLNAGVKKLSNTVDAEGETVKVSIAGDVPAEHGLATAANQTTVINASLRDINNTGAIGDGSSQHSSICLGYDRANGQGRSILVDANGTVETNVNMNTGHGLATEAKQDDLINATNRAINNTGSIGDGSTNATVVALGYDRANGKGRSLLVDADGTLQCDVVSGSVTETNSADILSDTTSIDGKITACNTGAVVVASGAITETNSAAILADTASLDTKITACNTGAVVVASGAITETNSTAILADTASLDAKIVSAGPVGSNGTTTAQTVNLMGTNDGTNFRTVKVGDGGAVNTEIDHSWDNTSVLINNVTIAAGTDTTSSEFDLGQGVSHEIGRVEVFVDNSAGVQLEVSGGALHTASGDLYLPASGTLVTSTEEKFTFSQEDVGLTAGHRLMKFNVENKDGSTATDVTLRVAYYK